MLKLPQSDTDISSLMLRIEQEEFEEKTRILNEKVEKLLTHLETLFQEMLSHLASFKHYEQTLRVYPSKNGSPVLSNEVKDTNILLDDGCRYSLTHVQIAMNRLSEKFPKITVRSFVSYALEEENYTKLVVVREGSGASVPDSQYVPDKTRLENISRPVFKIKVCSNRKDNSETD